MAMSEEMGLYVKLEADAGEFSAAMSASARALANLKVETEKLKQGEKEIRAAIESTSKSYEYQGNRIKELKKELREKQTALDKAEKSYGENSIQVKNLQQAISDLNQAIKTNTKNYSENEKQIERLNNDLVDNLKGQTDVKNEVKYVNSVIAKQTQEYQKNAKQAENTASATGKLRDGFNMLRAIALGYAGKTLFEALIGGNAEFEQYMTSFDVMLGSAEKAESMISEIEQFAANTPLQMDGVTQATELLLSYGVAQEDVMTRLQQLGDVSKGNAEKMQRVSLAYGQMVAKGKVTGEELRQMTEAGVPLMNALAESMGVTTAQLSKLIEKGQVGIPQLNSALESMTSEGGQFFGMMEKQSQTMSGLWSTLMDNVKIFAREAGEESFEYLKAELSDLMNTLNQMAADGSLSAMAKDIGGSIATVVKVIVELVKIILSMKEAIITVTGAWVGFKSAILIENIVLGLTNGFKALITTLTATKSVMAGTKVANDALKTSMATTPWGAILSIISLVAGALISFTSTIDDTNQKVIEQGEAAAETSNKLLELSSRYEELSEKNQLSTDEAAEFESVEKDLISTLGSKASALEGLTKGTNEYAEALKNATEEELRNQQGMATAAKIAAGENVQKSGKYSNIAYTGSKEYNNLSSIIDPYLSDFKQESDGYGRYIGLKNADIQETTEYYYALKDAMAALNAEMSKTGNNSIAQSNLYKAINQEIQSLSGSVDTYVQQLTNEETIKTRLRLGNPETLDEYNELKKAVFEATGAHESFKDTIYSVVDSAFPQFSGKTKEIKTDIDQLGETLGSSQKQISALSSVVNEYNENGKLSLETVQQMLSEHPEYVKYLTKEGDQYKLNQAALDDLSKAQQSQSESLDIYIEKMKEQEFGTREFANSYTEFMTALSEQYPGEFLSGLSEEIKAVNDEFVAGQTTAAEYFDALQEKIHSIDFSIFGLGESEEMQGLFAGFTQATAQGIEYITRQFQNGAMTVQEYTYSLQEANQNTLDLYTSSRNLEIVNGQWVDAGGMVDEYANNLQNASDSLSGFDSVVATIGGNIDYLSEHMDSFGNAAFTAADTASSAFQNLASGFQSSLESMYVSNNEAFNNIVADVASATGVMVEDITNGSGQINEGIFSNNVALNAGINSANNQLGQSINKVTQAAGKVITALGNAISNFDYKISLKPNITSLGKFDVGEWIKTGGQSGIELPNIDWNIKGSGGTNAAELGAAVADFGSALGSVDFGGLTLKSYVPRNTNTAPRSNTGNSKGGSGGSTGGGGSGGSGSSGSSSQREEKDTRLDNWKKERDEIEKEDKAWNEDQKKRGLISQNDYLYNLGERTRRYKEYAAWVLNLDFGTEEERQNIHEEYLEAAREADLDYLDFYINMCDEEAKAKQELGGPGDFEDAIKEIEKGKALIQQYYEQGILSAQEYERSLENVEKKIKNVQKAAYEARYDNSMKWIDDRNFYNDWKRGDNEIEAIRRVIEYTDEAKEAGILTWTEWCDKIDELEKKLYTAQKEIYEKMLQESYDTEKKAVEDKLELRKEELEAEKRMVQERADAEIKAIDDVLQKRKEQKEDSDDNLKLERLKNKLEYENDEDNRRALQKEIDQLESDIEDKMFEREMSAKKEQIKAEEESKIEAIENTIAHETELAENQIDYLTKMFELKMENINVATILHQSMNIDDYVNVGKEMGSGIAEGVRIAFKDGISELVKNVVTNATANIRAVAPANNIVNNNSNVNNTKSYTINQNISGNNAASPANVSAYYRRALKTAELEVM